MGLFKWLFGEPCQHDYHKIDSETRHYVDDFGILRSYEVYILYCPKCDKQKRVNADEYDRNIYKERLKRRYGGNSK